jgi:hypothetical protein
MNAYTEHFMLDGPIGALECALDLPDAGQFPQPIGIALVAHPHPLFGGSMNNKVAQTLARTFVSLGYATARMNFRGVGQSAGEHDTGIGETDDMAALLAYMRERFPALPLVLGGFSFGTYVMGQLQERLTKTNTPAQRLVLVGTAAGKWPIPAIPANTILIHGELDEIIPLQAVLDWLRPQEIPVTVIPGAEHFFHRRLHLLKQIIVNQWNAVTWGIAPT